MRFLAKCVLVGLALIFVLRFFAVMVSAIYRHYHWMVPREPFI